MPSQLKPIMQHYFALCLSYEAQDVFVPEDRHRPRHGFKRQPKIVSNITTVHRKSHHRRLSQAAI
jgi:hypothetical protein